jgi:hypothetical protein
MLSCSHSGRLGIEECKVASPTKIYMTRVALKNHKMGRKRKNQLNNKGTTPTRAAFFGDDVATESHKSA